MRHALEYSLLVDRPIVSHAQDAELADGGVMHEGPVATVLGLKGVPREAEEIAVARDLALARLTGGRLHLAHLSTAGAVDQIRQAKAAGVRVTAEVTPHHLLLTDELAASYDPVYKVNPPLRTMSDVHALREALIEGVIDVVATDHAPHAVEDKECEWAYARPGMVGLETALPVVLSVLGERWELIADRMSRTPARIAGLTGHGGSLAVGEPANLTLVDPSARRVVDPAELTSRSRNTPYAGLTLPGRIVATFLRGEPTVLDGKAVK
jgi:dihydroorotase